MTIAEELRSRNFMLCIALGISHLLHINILFIFGLLCLLSGLTLIFVEIPLLLRICPTSPTFDNFIRRFTTNYMRAAIYGAMSLIQWLSIIKDPTSLIAAAVVLLLAAVCYLIAGMKGQGFVGSKTLGGQGVAQMIV
ncbi:MAG: Golgi apparatus membrane protein tvp18 [Ramalina farinacea]|uniref:Golgi apparatus membrane protein tvp18 n=1 Tax=Ramalina farinacea TaxID=258253 RepID=A0AA43QV42_9LECA|nr:Golgi apparatus membrane protein tvp18 [Ramalina farinacea]